MIAKLHAIASMLQFTHSTHRSGHLYFYTLDFTVGNHVNNKFLSGHVVNVAML